MNTDTKSTSPWSFGTTETAHSLLRLDLPPKKPVAARNFQTYELPELLMRGFRQSFTPTQSLRLLHQQGSQALIDAANEDITPKTAAERIEKFMRSAEELEKRWDPVATTVDRFFVLTMVRENGYIDQMADVFAATHPADDSNSIRDELADHRKNNQPNVPRADVLELLEAVSASYGRIVTETVADIALNAPNLFGPSPQKQPIEDYQPGDRLATTVDELSELSDIDTCSKDELSTALRERVDGGIEPPDTRSPLLDLPVTAAEPIRFPTPDADPIPLSSAATDQILARAFRQGGFGIVIYDTPEGADWIFNPYVAAESTPEEFSYEGHWMRAYVTATLIERIRAATTPETSIMCPLCVLSKNRCGGDTCSCQPLFESVETIVEPLIQQTGTNYA